MSVSGVQVTGELQTLGFTAGQGIDGLPQSHVSQPHIKERLQGAYNPWLIVEEKEGLMGRHVKYIGNIVSPIPDIQDSLPEPFALAIRAGDKYVGKELHLDLFKPGSLAGLASAPGNIERKKTGTIAHLSGLACAGKETANRIHGPGVGQQIGPGGAANGPLVHKHRIVQK